MKLKKPFVVFDLETTGTWIEKDRIIEIAIIKIHPDGSKETYEKKINPQMPIPAKVQELTGISDEDVKDAPVFREIAQQVFDFIADADVGGFNVERFDLPLLERELKEAGITFEYKSRVIIDAQKIFHLHEKRDLTAAYQFYCQRELDNAHSALADTEATWEILQAQVDQYAQQEGDLHDLSKFDYKTYQEYYDDERKFRWWNGQLYMMFGKYARKYTLEEVVRKDRSYLEWILSANFSDQIKNLVEDALNGQFPKYQKEQETSEGF
ncbi:MAG: 3'-5' exonuclease [Candidatus Omnitrophica bacterium]|nr:3'-5' exonuclease [Candidatus Omnitrophota bacterium]